MSLKVSASKAIEEAFIALKDFTISLTMIGETSNTNYDEVSGSYKDIVKSDSVELTGLPEELVYSDEENITGNKYDLGCVVLENALPVNFDELSNLKIEIDEVNYRMVGNKKDPASITRILMLSKVG